MTKNDGDDESAVDSQGRTLIEKAASAAYDNLSMPSVSRVTSCVVIGDSLYMLTLKRIPDAMLAEMSK